MRVYSHGGNTILGGSFNVQIHHKLGIGPNNPDFPLTVYGAGDYSIVSSYPPYGWNTNNSSNQNLLSYITAAQEQQQITAYFQNIQPP